MRNRIAMLAVALVAGIAAGQEAENETCPVSGRTVAASAPTATHDGHTVGFCCSGCVGTFTSWDDQRKDGFVLTFASNPAQPADAAAFEGDPYVLGTCPISGKTLGEGAVTKTIDDREVRFCCGGCPEAFEASKEEQFAKLDKAMIADQMAYYPLKTCLVGGESLYDNGEDIATNYVYKNRLVRFCCSDCIEEFKKDPASYIATLDSAVVKAQREAYPLNTCLVGKGELGSMGEPTETIVANRLVRFCCGMCEPKLRKDPSKYIPALDEAWKKAGMPWTEEKESKRGTTTVGS